MFSFFLDQVCHAKRAHRNSGLTDKKTSWKNQNINGNIYAFFLSHVIFIYLEQVWLQRSYCYNFSTTKSTIIGELYVKQDQFIYFLPVPCEKDIFPIKTPF